MFFVLTKSIAKYRDFAVLGRGERGEGTNEKNSTFYKKSVPSLCGKGSDFCNSFSKVIFLHFWDLCSMSNGDPVDSTSDMEEEFARETADEIQMEMDTGGVRDETKQVSQDKELSGALYSRK